MAHSFGKVTCFFLNSIMRCQIIFIHISTALIPSATFLSSRRVISNLSITLVIILMSSKGAKITLSSFCPLVVSISFSIFYPFFSSNRNSPRPFARRSVFATPLLKNEALLCVAKVRRLAFNATQPDRLRRARAVLLLFLFHSFPLFTDFMKQFFSLSFPHHSLQF